MKAKRPTPKVAAPAPPVRLFNREFSWIAFNNRVLAEAADRDVPLLERLKFISIASTNLDEFLMVRLGAMRELIANDIDERSPDGLTPRQQLRGMRTRIKKLLMDASATLEQLMPSLRKAGIRIDRFTTLGRKQQETMRAWFDRHIGPVLTPLAVDQGHPFPFLTSRALNLGVVLVTPSTGATHIAFIKVPPLLPRFVRVDAKKLRFVPLEELIRANLDKFFPGLQVRSATAFRVIRNADLTLEEDEVQDLLKSIESELRRREKKDVVWMEIAAGADPELLSLITTELKVGRDDIFVTPAIPKLGDLIEIYQSVRKAALKDPPFMPRLPPPLTGNDNIFTTIRRGDVMLHRPYDSFAPVIELVETAAADPDVVAIKQTLYRADTGSAIIEALARAAEAGKQVTAIVELQARFDELKNITWAKRLERAGVQVVYGLIGIKTHCKLCLIVRRESGDLRRYVHLSTGNYNSATARIYTDLDLMTTDEAIAEDAAHLMNLLTGYSLATAQEVFEEQVSGWEWLRLVPAPLDYHEWVIRMIRREAKNAAGGKPAQILAKMNALVEPQIIEELYAASRAGVKIELIVRGICCLVPGVQGLSENIRVISIIDRFLEHTRIFLFRNAGGTREIYASSGDWMPRNLFRRVELTFPILDPKLAARVEDEILATCLRDNVKAWKLLADGTYRKRSPRPPRLRSQERFMELARVEPAPADAKKKKKKKR